MTTDKKIVVGIVLLCAAISGFASNSLLPLLNEPVDISGDFHDFSNLYYLADRLADFDPAAGRGKITYQRSEYFTRQAFDNMLAVIKPVAPNEFPEDEYQANPSLPFSIEFVSPRTIRIRMVSGPQVRKPQEELMLADAVPSDHSWKYQKIDGGHRYKSNFGSVTILESPFHIEIRDASGKLLTQTDHALDNVNTFTPIMPFAFVRRAVLLLLELEKGVV